MYGAIFGDFVGSVYEFNNIDHKDFDLYSPFADITDDTLMTIAVASACLNYAGTRDLDEFESDVGREMHRIGRLYPFPKGGYGSMFRKWLASRDPKPYGSWGNGSAMRVSACAWVADSLGEAEMLGWTSACPTHDHPDAMIGAKAVAGCVYLARTGVSKRRIMRYLRQKFYPMETPLSDYREKHEFDKSCRGTVQVALQAFLESTDYEDAIRNAISVGGDSDTIAAITGAVAEAYYGMPELLIGMTKRILLESLSPDELDIVNEFRAEFCGRHRKAYCLRVDPNTMSEI